MDKFLTFCAYVVVILTTLGIIAATIIGFILEPVVVGIIYGVVIGGIIVAASINRVTAKRGCL